MKSTKIITKTPEETLKMAERLGKKVSAGDIICLFGDLGAGKTTFVKGLAKGLKFNSTKVKSPTFVLMNIYEGRLPVYHFDLYRIEANVELAMIGYDEFLYGDGVAVIEWAERLNTLMPQERLDIELTHRNPEERMIKMIARGNRYETFIH